MVNYQQGKIYKIVSDKTEKVYVGSTTKKTLAQRMAKHKNDYKGYLQGKGKNITSFKILELGDAQIFLLENFPCDSKDELHKRERYWVEQFDCVNRCMPSRTMQEWRQDNRDRLLKSSRDYMKEYREKNKQIISQKKKEKKQCACGSVITKNDSGKHKKTRKHEFYEINKIANIMKEHIQKIKQMNEFLGI